MTAAHRFYCAVLIFGPHSTTPPAPSAAGDPLGDEIIGELARILAAGYLRLQKIRRVPEPARQKADSGLDVGLEQSVHGDDRLTRGDDGDGGPDRQAA